MENQLIQQSTAPSTFNFFDPVQFETMQRVCKMFANSELVPDMYKVSEKNPETKAMANCMIATSIAQRINADVLMVMQNLVIIYGKPSWSSKFLIATVNSCGRFNPLQFKFTEKGALGKVDYTEYDKVWDRTLYGGKGGYKTNAKTLTFDGTKIPNIECIAWTTAKGSDEILESSPISIEMAIKEGWYLKSGSKWQTMPRQMLMYRAASFWTNVYAPELSMGMKTTEEVHDIVDVEYEDVTTKVDNEKTEKANKEEISMTVDENESAGDTPKDNGENQANQDKGAESTDKSQPRMPGF